MSIEETLANLDWDSRPAPGPDDIDRAAIAACNGMPKQLRELYAAANGGHIDGVYLFDLSEYSDVNGQQALFAMLGRVAFFASDGGDGWFFIDETGALGKGQDHVFFVERGSLRPAASVPCAPGLGAFLHLLGRGEQPWLGADLEGLAQQRALDVLAAHGDRWDGEPGAGILDVLDAGSRCGVAVPTLLAKLLQVANGLAIPSADVVLFGVDEIEPVVESMSDGMPAALWIGRRCAARLALVTARGWHDWPAAELVELQADGVDGTALGQLADMLVTWLSQAVP